MSHLSSILEKKTSRDVSTLYKENALALVSSSSRNRSHARAREGERAFISELSRRAAIKCCLRARTVSPRRLLLLLLRRIIIFERRRFDDAKVRTTTTARRRRRRATFVFAPLDRQLLVCLTR
jgi:hypothetical protein